MSSHAAVPASSSTDCDVDDLQWLPFVDGVYRTAPRRVPLWARLSPGGTYYPQLLRVIFRASYLAKRGRYGDPQWVETSADLFRALENLGVEIEITGAQHLAQTDTPCLVVGNHVGTLESTVLPAIIRPFFPVTFIVKRGLIEYPVFKHVMRSRHPIAVSQTNPREDFKTVLEEGAERLARGLSLIIFPEGRRTEIFDSSKFNTLGVKLAQRSDAPIVPLALATHGWKLGRWLKDFGPIDPSRKVRFAFGEPIRVQGRGAVEQQQIIDFISQKLRAWEVEDAQRGVQSPKYVLDLPTSDVSKS